jgi:hypothetical protein
VELKIPEAIVTPSAFSARSQVVENAQVFSDLTNTKKARNPIVK